MTESHAPDLTAADLTSADLTAANTPAAEAGASIDLDASMDEVLEALRDPELLSAWLGGWTEHHAGPDAPLQGAGAPVAPGAPDATVLTDDGRLRRVTDRRFTEHGVEWRWSHHDDRAGRAEQDGPASEESLVSIRLTEVDGRTRLTVHEVQVQASARPSSRSTAAAMRSVSVVLDSATWLAGLLALGAVLAASSLVRV